MYTSRITGNQTTNVHKMIKWGAGRAGGWGTWRRTTELANGRKGLKVHLMICRGLGGKITAQNSASDPKETRTRHFARRGLRLLKGPFKGRTQWGSPGRLGHDTRSLRKGNGRRAGKSRRRESPVRPWKAILPPHAGAADTRPRPNLLCLPNHLGQPQHLSLLPASPSVPGCPPAAPPNAAGRPSSGPGPAARPLAHPPAPRSPQPRDKKDAGPGLPGSSRAYL